MSGHPERDDLEGVSTNLGPVVAHRIWPNPFYLLAEPLTLIGSSLDSISRRHWKEDTRKDEGIAPLDAPLAALYFFC